MPQNRLFCQESDAKLAILKRNLIFIDRILTLSAVAATNPTSYILEVNTSTLPI